MAVMVQMTQKEELLTRLIEKGQRKGTLAVDEVLRVFPDIENDVNTLDEVIDSLIDAGIDVVSSNRDDEIELPDEAESVDSN